MGEIIKNTNRPKVTRVAFVKFGYMLENPCIRRYLFVASKNASGAAVVAKAMASQRTISREESNERRQVNATL